MEQMERILDAIMCAKKRIFMALVPLPALKYLLLTPSQQRQHCGGIAVLAAYEE
jgi:hypothetical protein